MSPAVSSLLLQPPVQVRFLFILTGWGESEGSQATELQQEPVAYAADRGRLCNFPGLAGAGIPGAACGIVSPFMFCVRV